MANMECHIGATGERRAPLSDSTYVGVGTEYPLHNYYKILAARLHATRTVDFARYEAMAGDMDERSKTPNAQSLGQNVGFVAEPCLVHVVATLWYELKFE